jgi:2-phospho-L-lactate/phosphoenolpyruvate guanylyltransferase
MPVPLIPVKALAEAKGRLAPRLEPLERRLLAIAMFEDVVAALRAVPALGTPLVVSPDREVWRRAEALGCRVVEESPAAAGHGDPAHGLNAALVRAATGLDGTDGLLVVAADLPLASGAGLELVLEAAARAPVVVVPSRDGGGTNVLAWREPPSFAPRFGPESAARHLGVPGAVRVEEPGLALDVDTAEDLLRVAGRLDPGSVTGRRLRDLGLQERLGKAG